ncbi:MAG: 3'-5' exonuclease [Firmicutes bacterium]|nr:3'-5' exonuclease [Bacillota bacterium]
MEQMGPLVIDIETSGNFEDLPQAVQAYLVEREERRLGEVGAEQDPETNVIETLALNPAAGIVVSIGLWLVNQQRGLVLVNNSSITDNKPVGVSSYQDVPVVYGSEAEILQVFWSKLVEKAGFWGQRPNYPIITFNGRAFDAPFLMLRSALYGLKPTRNLMGYRYSFLNHCDLQEVLTFTGALGWQHRYSLDFWCNMFGISSPKQDMDGSQVGEVWRKGDLERLIEYSLADIQATAELYLKLQPLIATLQEN